jgi:hypothetical protein
LERLKLQNHFFTSLEIIQVTSKSAILIGEFLVNCDDIFGKRASNVTCSKKTPPNLAKWFGRYATLKFKNF